MQTRPESIRPENDSMGGCRWRDSTGRWCLTVGGWWVLSRESAHALTAKTPSSSPTFANTTGDPVFDGTLRAGLAVQLEQSPFLTLVSEQRVQQTLRLMGQPPDARLTPEIARDLCQRTRSTAFIDGSIASLGSQYVLGLKAVNCHTGDSLAEEQAPRRAKSKSLRRWAMRPRNCAPSWARSLSTVQKFDTPLEQATTPSLEALQAYSLGRKTMGEGDFAAAVPLFQRAIRLDPNSPWPMPRSGRAISNLGELSLAAENTRKAYDLRERVSEREKFYIESHYYDYVTGDLEKARQAYELWAQTYPRRSLPPDNLGLIYGVSGNMTKPLRNTARPSVSNRRPVDYANLVGLSQSESPGGGPGHGRRGAGEKSRFS